MGSDMTFAASSSAKFCMTRKSAETRDVVVVFSAARLRPGSFMLSRVLKSCAYNQIFLNTPTNNWYLDGVPGLGCSIYELAQSIESMVGKLKGDNGKVVCVGSSMGAYAAVFVGALINADYIFATGGEYRLNLDGGFSKNMLTVEETPVSIDSIVRSSKGRYFLGYGSESAVDAYCLSAISSLAPDRILGFGIDRWGHSVPRLIERKWGYSAVITSVLRHSLSLIPDELDGMHNNQELCEGLWKARHKPVSEFSKRELRDLVDILCEYSEDGNPPAWRARAMFARSVLDLRTDGNSYFDAAFMASSLAKGNPFFLNHLARAYVKSGDLENAEAVLKESMELQAEPHVDRDPMTEILYSRILLRQDKLVSAVNVLSKALHERWSEACANELSRVVNLLSQTVEGKQANKLR
jgi:hypothetical protein